MKYWAGEPDSLNSYKVFERNMKLLKWRTLRSKLNDKANPRGGGGVSKVDINSKILGLGPHFIVKLEIENSSNNPIFNIEIVISYDGQNMEILKEPGKICMLTPFTPILKEIEIKSITLKP